MKWARRKNLHCPAIHEGTQRNLGCKKLHMARRGDTRERKRPFPLLFCWKMMRCRRLGKVRYERQTARKCYPQYPNLQGRQQNSAGTPRQTLTARCDLTPCGMQPVPRRPGRAGLPKPGSLWCGCALAIAEASLGHLGLHCISHSTLATFSRLAARRREGTGPHPELQ